MDLVVQVLEVVNSFAHAIGLLLLTAVQLVVPAAIPESLSAPMGWLVLLTASLAVTELAKKLTWLVVGTGWLLIAIRIAVVVVRS